MTEAKPLEKMNTYEFSMLILQRDLAQYQVQRIDELINKYSQDLGYTEAETKQPIKIEAYDPEKIVWIEAEGKNGKFQRSNDDKSPDFERLVQDIEVHRGKLVRNSYFYWIFSDNSAIGRKPTKK